MNKQIENENWLKEYAIKKKIEELNSEDIMKLIEVPFLIKDIEEAFDISEKEFNEIRKKYSIKNIYLESNIRNIDVILYYIDLKGRYVSNKIRNDIVDFLISIFSSSYPKSEYYRKKLSEINFTREYVEKEIAEKNIDIDYRLDINSFVLKDVDNLVEKLLLEEKDIVLNYNHEKLYEKFLEKQKQGRYFQKEDLTKDILYELAVIENKSDYLIGEIFNLCKTQVRYLRKKYGFSNKFLSKIQKYPESLIYYMEKKGERNLNISNYEYEKLVLSYIQNIDKKSDNTKMTIDLNNVNYTVTVSNEKYEIKASKKHKKNNGSHHNYKMENETKIQHGKLGEQLVLKFEKRKLKEWGLDSYTDDIRLLAQINEEITLDGLGYDLISFNEFGERICIEVKTSFGNRDKPFFISPKEIEVMKGYAKEYDCNHCFIYYVLIDGTDVIIKQIDYNDFKKYKLEPVLYQIKEC